MSYSTEVEKQDVARDMLVLMRPRRRVTSWTLSSGSVYYSDFSFGYVTSVKVDGVALAAGSSSSLSAGEFYYDLDAGRLYIRKTSGAPSGSDWIVGTFELYFSSREVYWHRDPQDTTKDQVLWRGIIQESPEISRASGDEVFGFLPIASTSVRLGNAAEYLQEMIHESSFNKADCVVYHLAGELATTNVEKLFTGVCGDPTVEDKTVSIEILDKTYNLDTTITNGTESVTYSDTGGTDGTGPDPAFAGQTIRQIYGRWSGVRLVCVDAEIDSPTTGENRSWGFQTGAFYSGITYLSESGVTYIDGITKEVATTAEIEAIAEAFAMGFITMELDGGLGKKTTYVTAVNVATKRFTVLDSHLATTSYILVPFNNVYLIRDQTYYRLEYGAQYTISSLLNIDDSIYGLSISANTESDFSISTINPQTDMIVADVLGTRILPTIEGDLFGSSYNPLVILYHLLLNVLGMSASEIDGDAFVELAASSRSRVACAIPAESFSAMPTFKDVITKLLTSEFLQAYFDADGKFTIRRIGTLGSYEVELDEDQTEDVSFEYSCKDMAEVRCQGGPVENNIILAKGSSGSPSGPLVNNTAGLHLDQSSNYEANNYLHQNDRVRVIPTNFVEANFGSAITWTAKPDLLTAQEFADRMGQIIGERGLKVSLFAKTGAAALEVGDTVRITRKKMPGFAFDGETENSRDFRVIETKKQREGVHLVLTDQKGIEDNSSDWA